MYRYIFCMSWLLRNPERGLHENEKRLQMNLTRMARSRSRSRERSHRDSHRDRRHGEHRQESGSQRHRQYESSRDQDRDRYKSERREYHRPDSSTYEHAPSDHRHNGSASTDRYEELNCKLKTIMFAPELGICSWPSWIAA